MIGELISDFYALNDGCAYIQVGDAVFQFDEKFNPLGLPNLPMFRDAVMEFVVSVRVSDDLKEIKLWINAVQPEDAVFAGKNRVSFRKSDPNYVMKKVSRIQV